MRSSRRLIVVIGVSGSGKTTIGRAVADRGGWPFVEGDDFHPPANVEKMAAGVSLTDADRVPWVEAIVAHVDQCSSDSVVLACSALTRSVQVALMKAHNRQVIWYHLRADKACVRERMIARVHFMPSSLIDSQFEALAPPDDAINIDASESIDALVAQILRNLN